MKIVILGDVCIDKNSVEGASYEYFGSPAMYINMILSKFDDADVTIVTNYGEDFFKYSEGINLLPTKPNLENSLQYQNIVRDGVRTQFAKNYNYSEFMLERSELEMAITNADAIIFAPITPNYSDEYIENLLSMNNKAIKLILPQGYFRQFDSENKVYFRDFSEADKLLPLFDFAVMSDEDYPDILNFAKIWSKEFNTDFIITRGENGADLYFGVDWMHDAQVINVPTAPVTEIKDSTGSGDTFSAAFFYMYLKTKDTAKSIGFGNMVAGKMLAYTPEEMKAIKL